LEAIGQDKVEQYASVRGQAYEISRTRMAAPEGALDHSGDMLRA
jgi:hypothetical protein